MPQNKNSEAPPVMTWKKAMPVLAVALIADALILVFEQFWFFGPALGAALCGVGASQYIGASLGTAVCGGAAIAAGTLAAPALILFGTVMAMAVGLLGWLAVGLMLVFTNPRIFKANEKNMLWFAAGLLVSELPLIGFFGIIGATAKMYHEQIKKDAENLKKYEKEQAARQAQEQAELIQARAAQLAQAEIY